MREFLLFMGGLLLALLPFQTILSQSALYLADTHVDSGLAAYYPFTGNANDASGNGNNAVPDSPDLTTDRFGSDDNAYMWDGVDDKMRVADADAFKITGSLSIACWAKPLSSPPGRAAAQIVFRGDDRVATDPYYLAIMPTGRLRFHISSGSADKDIETPITYGTWQHYAATLDSASGSMKLYLNSVEVYSETTNVRPFRDLDPFASPGIGFGNTQSYSPVTHFQPFDGPLDDIRIYHRTLQSSEIDTLYNEGGWPQLGSTIIASAGPNGMISPADTVHVSFAGDQHFTITPDGGYLIDSLIVDGVNVPPTTEYTFTDVMTDHSIRVVFRQSNIGVGLAAYYPFTGNANDASGNGNNAVPDSPDLAADRFGSAGNAYLWDGVDDKMRVADADAFKITGSLSIACWARPLSSPPGRAAAQIVFRGDDRVAYDPYYLAIMPTGMLRFHISSGSADAEFETPITYGAWQHYAATLDSASGSVKLYLNSVEVYSETTNVRPFRDLDPFASPGIGIGNTQSYSLVDHFQPFDGPLDEIRIYHRALLPADIIDLYGGPVTAVGEGNPAASLPTTARLRQNYPNPFNPGTTIRFDVPEGGHVMIMVYDVLGSEVAVLVDGFETPGVKSVYWDASGAPGGVYFVRMTSSGFREMRKMVLLK